MKNGKAIIITGCILIALQLISIMGNFSTGGRLPEPSYNFAYTLGSYAGYYLFGITGAIFLIIGVFIRHKHKQTAHMEQDTTAYKNKESTEEQK